LDIFSTLEICWLPKLSLTPIHGWFGLWLTGIAFLGQISDGAGPGAWVTATTCIISLYVTLHAFVKVENEITLIDKVSLAACIFSIIPWVITDSALISISIITVIDFLGFLPTIRKSLSKPFEETLIHYVLAGTKFGLAIIALENYSVITWLYPASLVLANYMFILLLVIQRKKFKDPKIPNYV